MKKYRVRLSRAVQFSWRKREITRSDWGFPGKSALCRPGDRRSQGELNSPVRLSEKADESLYEIHDYLTLSSLNTDLARSFVAGLRNYTEKALNFLPSRFPVYKGGIRRAVYPKNTNYLIFFEISEDSAEVFVLDVVNASRYTRYKDLA
uniref:ParE toxin of type II toxin-antitoxin system, parDE n=3 Tax=Candidatus Kentrum sp. FM TaxID=2126340 RepID=A0A450TP29_9GAMM|nr:MAG: ParE toxin of type II toxin-antitoxin system, parDE [Candidatus Kentron sp. FM]